MDRLETNYGKQFIENKIKFTFQYGQIRNGIAYIQQYAY